MKKSSNIFITALHRFIPQPASGRSSALPYLAALLVWSKFWRFLRLHSYFFVSEFSGNQTISLQLQTCSTLQRTDVFFSLFCNVSTAFGQLFDRRRFPANNIFFFLFLFLVITSGLFCASIYSLSPCKVSSSPCIKSLTAVTITSDLLAYIETSYNSYTT